ncbi:MAG: hypothetical protein HY899_15570 [Deltaproteobacteria bacterium]|nr:hypothetical protein [Deltaproteobacteria bacterium]
MTHTRFALAQARASAVLLAMIAGGAALGGAAGCQSSPPPAEPVSSTAESKPAVAPGVTIGAEAAARLGVATQVLAAAQYREQIDAVAVGVDPAPLFQLAGDLEVAEAAQRLSDQSLERARKLYADSANGSRQSLEAAEAAAAQDAAHVALLERRLATEWGGPLAVAESRRKLVGELGRGLAAIVRIDMDPSAVVTEQPAALQVRIPSVALSSTEAGATTGEPWAAPTANPLRPGQSLFAVASDASVVKPGWRAQALVASSAPPRSGALLPAQALVYAGGRAWCYATAAQPGAFRRAPVDVSRPVAGGYFIAGDPGVGAAVVIAGAGLLLAEELGSQTDQD